MITVLYMCMTIYTIMAYSVAGAIQLCRSIASQCRGPTEHHPNPVEDLHTVREEGSLWKVCTWGIYELFV